jgi:2-aminoethylphosphonate-pyruvate transaminase
MAALGFRTFLARTCRRRSSSPSTRRRPAYNFKAFYEKVKARGYILYPGKLTQVETFRVGCIGAIDSNEMRNVVSAVKATLQDMGIKKVAMAAVAA